MRIPQQLTRTIVNGGLSAARLPLSAAELVARPSRADQWPPTVAFSRFDAGVRTVAGSLLGNHDLVAEGRLKQAAADRLAEAAELRAVGEQRDRAAAEGLQQAQRAAVRQAERAEEAREQAHEQSRQDLQADRERADETVQRGAEQAARVREAGMVEVQRRGRPAKAVQLAAEGEALAEQRDAVDAKAEIHALDDALAASKAAREAEQS